MHGVVELELMVCDDFTSTTILVGENTVLEADDGVCGADGWTLGRDVCCDIVGGDFKGAGVVFIAAVGVLR